ncbi:hypothetical protein [Flavobacterium selenitireducens]|uniref:hypothetical protein n=1 Tax=Flavobacterium selenitireducens TaxID=2722704 RepID=UPI00168BEA87|nr:hypothetical protein [Flavobacterium selenitireducens]MBD3581721.1 hypothetical protein [Flavobacterium selenitireducens]
MKRILIIFAALAAVSCKSDKAEPAGEQPYFIFDKVTYYHKELAQGFVDSLYANQEKSRKDQGLLQIVTGNVPVNPRDTLFVNNMEILEFSKKEIDKSKNEQLAKIFSQKNVTNSVEETACKPIFKDILVFRQKGNIVGVAKISFDCKKQQMVGIRYSPEDFGKAGEYEELQKLLGSL